jgi:diguanylate cyclase (GGDEF)-like protein
MKGIDDISETHQLLGILQHVDVGLVVLDREHRIKLWNGFMENHSGFSPGEVHEKSLFNLFPELPRDWLSEKLNSVFLLNNRAFTTWQQRPFLFRFDSYRPITSPAPYMFQNVTFFPLTSLNGEVEHVCLMVYDMTEEAMDEKALQQANRELEQLGRTDGLTRLYNRRAWEELLSSEYSRCERSGGSAVLVMFDIDHFKRVNDTYGHQAGDDVIRSVADLLRDVKREPDISGRYGGEEFGVILPETNIAGASVFAERLRSAVEAHTVKYGNEVIRFTISLGLSEIKFTTEGYSEWLESADRALYSSKEAGRNRVSIAD